VSGQSLPAVWLAGGFLVKAVCEGLLPDARHTFTLPKWGSMSGRRMLGHSCQKYGRPRAYSLLPWRERYSGLSPYRKDPGWGHSLGRYEHGGGWRCPVCGDEWSLWVGLGGLLRFWSPARDEESGKQFSSGPDGRWWSDGYRAESEAAGTRCAHAQIKVIKASRQAPATRNNVLLYRCRRCGRVVRWEAIGE
jgi:predicted RNA-binding Zn-ribbon protein involved in translation (DUF1610 family)